MCHSTLQKVADPKKNISMHKILFFGKEPPIKKKEVVQFRVGEEKDVGTSEDVLFENTGTKIHMLTFNFGCELLLLFSSLHI